MKKFRFFCLLFIHFLLMLEWVRVNSLFGRKGPNEIWVKRKSAWIGIEYRHMYLVFPKSVRQTRTFRSLFCCCVCSSTKKKKKKKTETHELIFIFQFTCACFSPRQHKFFGQFFCFFFLCCFGSYSDTTITSSLLNINVVCSLYLIFWFNYS